MTTSQMRRVLLLSLVYSQNSVFLTPVFLCDRTKLGQTSRVQICDPTQIDTLITDGKALAEQTSPFRELGAEVLV